jgi:hypothetical protein
MHRGGVLALIVSIPLAVTGCGRSSVKPPTSSPHTTTAEHSATIERGSPGSIAMMKLPARPASRCRATPVRPACPGVIPRVPYKLVSGQVAGGILHGFVVAGPSHVNQFWVFDLQHGAPSDTNPRRNRPPAVLHMTFYARNIREAIGMAYPGARRDATLSSRTVAGKRPLLFGMVTWSGRKGALFLAPSYPLGGQIGGHLAFWWRAHGTNYLMSIHAWEPLTECVRVLRRVVASASSP